MTETEAPRRLRIYLERIERLEEERKAFADDIAEVYRELSGDGFDKDAAKVVLKIRKATGGIDAYTEKSATVDLYLSALGMLGDALPAPARPREIIEQFPPHDTETGEIIESHPSPLPSPMTDESPAQSLPVSGTLSDSNLTQAVTNPSEDVPAFLLKDRPPLRPLCLNPSECAGYGTHTCHRCLTAAGRSEVAA